MAAWFRRMKAINWRRGSSELIGFALIIPLLATLMFTIITVMQLGLVRQSLEYATYMGARAAVVCEDYSTALTQAQTTARMTLGNSTYGVDQNSVSVRLELVGGTSSTSGSGITWEKGALLKCEVSAPINQFINILSGDMTSCIYVMVERPARTYY